MRALVATALTLGVAAPAAAGVRHDPLTCVPPGVHARVVASAVPADAAASAEVAIRTGRGAWYALVMERGDDGGWSAVLPRPTASLASFEYRVLLPPAGETAVLSVRVGKDCTRPAEGAPPVLVRKPSPDAPDVPAGFDTAGVTADAGHEVRPKQASRRPVVLGIAGVAAAVGGAVALSSGAPGGTAPNLTPSAANGELPTFSFTGTSPPPGSTVSASASTFAVFLQMDHEPATPVDLEWRVDFRRSNNSALACVVMQGTFEDAKRPLGLALTNRLVPLGFCGDTIDTDVMLVSVRAGGQLVFEASLSLAFHFQP